MFESNKCLNKSNLLSIQLDSRLRGNDGREVVLDDYKDFCKGLK